MALVCTGQTENQALPEFLVCDPCDDRWDGIDYPANMADEDRNYLKAWREFRRMKQEELAEKVGTTKAVISLLENEKRPLSSKWLRKLAEALDTQPGHILDHDPNELPSDVFDIWQRIDQRDREQAARVLRSFDKTGTHN
jgi:transcriptional regulator with XRE-family HTH domain